jgi:hypothetical protein
MANFQIIAQNIDVSPMLNALRENEYLWNANNLRTTHMQSPHKQVDDIWVRFNKIDADLNRAVEDKEAYWYPASGVLPVRSYMYPLLEISMGERFGRCVITRMKPDTRIDSHVDHGSPVAYYQRFHLALNNAPGANFICGDETFCPQTGDLFILDNSKEHEVVNNSTEDRITMIIDIRTPFFEHIKTTIDQEPQQAQNQTVLNNDRVGYYGPGYTYQVESFEKCQEDFRPFVMQHWNELGLTKEDVPIDFDWERFFAQDRQGKLHTVTVRKDGALVGYHITFLGSHPHYRSTLHGMVDLYYLVPDLRKGRTGMKMFKFAEEKLKELGVVKVYTGCKVKFDHTRLFEYLGYEFSDKQFIKIL